MKQKAYARAGVDIDLGNKVKATLPGFLASTHRREVLGKVGGFGGLFALDTRKYKEPVLVSSVDGVGTKLKIAFAMDQHDTIGEDLVNHCVNDIAVLGAEPLFFLDYIGTGKLKPHVFKAIIQGFARGCAANNCSLIGGETAQMPGFLPGRRVRRKRDHRWGGGEIANARWTQHSSWGRGYWVGVERPAYEWVFPCSKNSV